MLRFVALHGMLGAPDDWQPVADDVGGEWIGVDLLDAIDDGVTGFDAFCEWLTERVPELPGVDDCLVGYSLGGRLAMHALVRCGTRWQSGVIVSAHPGLESDDEKASRIDADSEWEDRFRDREVLWGHALERWNAQPVLAGAGDEWITSRMNLESRRSAVADAMRVWSLGRQSALWPELADCPTPCLWVAGAGDAKFSELSHRASSACLRGELALIDGVGHRVLHESPAGFGAILSDWVARIG